MQPPFPQPLFPRWDAVLLVCKACGKRGNGPTEVQPKAVAQALRQGAKAARSPTRVVLTGCMGLCPKRATAVVQAAPGAALRAVAIETQAQLRQFAGLE